MLDSIISIPQFDRFGCRSKVMTSPSKLLSTCFLFSVLSAFSVPLAYSEGAAVNVASYANPNLPNGNLAQGGMFTVFAPNIGPATLVQATDFPLPFELGGTSIEATVGGQTLDCIMIFAVSGQAAAILPSATPIGDGTMSVHFNGVLSATFGVTVVRHSFGTFSVNQQGNGPAVITDPSFALNTLTHSANADDVWIIWGTGLGAVQGNEAAMPLPGELPYDVRVFVGNVETQVIARSRSGCCAGIDQIAFFIPQGVTGCYVSVHVVVEGVTSNFTSMSIAPSGSFCTEGGVGITPSILSRAEQNGSVTIASISLSRQRVSIQTASPLVIDTANAYYTRFDLSGLIAWGGLPGNISTVGSCTVIQYSGADTSVQNPVLKTVLDAGSALQMQGPRGNESIPRNSAGTYAKTLTQVTPLEPTLSDYLDYGIYTVTSMGGADVSAHSADITIGEPFIWSNRNELTTIERSQPLILRYTGGVAGQQIRVYGNSPYTIQEDTYGGAAFFCVGEGNLGSFTIPATVLNTLPDSPISDTNQPTGVLSLEGVQSNSFIIPGFDLAEIKHVDRELVNVDYN